MPDVSNLTLSGARPGQGQTNEVGNFTLPLLGHFNLPATGGDLFVFRGRAGTLIKIIWHDGIGMSLYAKRLEKGRFVWPSASEGTVSLTPSQLACLLEGVDWRNPQYTWRPASAG
jgi:transposase